LRLRDSWVGLAVTDADRFSQSFVRCQPSANRDLHVTDDGLLGEVPGRLEHFPSEPKMAATTYQFLGHARWR